MGTITDGDIRRALLDGATVDYPVEKVMNKDFLFIKQENYSEQKAVNYLLSILLNNTILDTKKNLVSIIFLMISKQYLIQEKILLSSWQEVWAKVRKNHKRMLTNASRE